MAQKLFAADELTLTRYAAEALTAYRFVKYNSSNTERVDMADTQGEQVLGVTKTAWDSGDEACQIIYAGIPYLEAGGAIAIGDYITNDTSGRAVKASGVVAADFIHGQAESAASAAGDLLAVRLNIGGGASISSIGAGRKLLVIPITHVAGDESSVEQDTGYDLPTKAIVKNVYVDVSDAEASTIDVGTDGTGSNDPNGWLAAASISATGLVKGTLASGGQTLGALLCVDESGAGVLVPEDDIASGGESITWGAGADLTSFAANIIIDYIEVK
jgi:hypothetical protein